MSPGVSERLPPAYFYDVDDVSETDDHRRFNDDFGGAAIDDIDPDDYPIIDNDGSADNDASLDDQLEQLIDDIAHIVNHFYDYGPDDDDIVDGSDEPDPGDEHQ